MSYDNQLKIISDVLMGLSWLCVIFAIMGFVGGEAFFNIASTQWLLISVVFAANSIFLLMHAPKK